jgi:hypothetical protein
LFSDNFMHIATYAWVPLQYVVEMIEDRVLPAETKVLVWGRCGCRTHRAMVFAQPSLQGLTELAVEHFWRVRAMPGQLDYDPQIAGMLQRYGVTLPFTDSRTSPANRYVYCKLHNGHSVLRQSDCYEDEFRLYTHRMTKYSGYPPCSCWGCQVRPFKEAREREAWESKCYTL